jgi:type II secretory pathway component PulK
MTGTRRGSVVVVVVWAVAIAAVLVSATQIVSFRQAVIGRESLARVQARWAARAGLEQMIAVMEWHLENPDPDDPMAVVRDMEEHAIGEVSTGGWDIRHFLDGIEWAGPMDEGAKLNVNMASRAQLGNLPGMTPDVVDAIIDWRDTNDEVEGLGAESNYYSNRAAGYRPRNANFKSIAEVELVAGAWPDNLRGEDWNLNGRLDPNEDDGPRTYPDDKPDGKLDAGWSQYLTASSMQSPVSLSGEEKLKLDGADEEGLIKRLGITAEQARALMAFGAQPNAKPETLLVTPLSQLASGGSQGTRTTGAQGGTGGRTGQAAGPATRTGSASSGRSSGGRSTTGSGTPAATDLTPQQLRIVLRELTGDDFSKPVPGRLNINTVPATVLKEVLEIDARVADAIVARRKAKPEGITSLADLSSMTGINPQVLGTLATQFDVTSSVYTVTSRGRAASTGAEVELEAVVDRSKLPARIASYRER